MACGCSSGRDCPHCSTTTSATSRSPRPSCSWRAADASASSGPTSARSGGEIARRRPSPTSRPRPRDPRISYKPTPRSADRAHFARFPCAGRRTPAQASGPGRGAFDQPDPSPSRARGRPPASAPGGELLGPPGSDCPCSSGATGTPTPAPRRMISERHRSRPGQASPATRSGAPHRRRCRSIHDDALVMRQVADGAVAAASRGVPMISCGTVRRPAGCPAAGPRAAAGGIG